MIRKLGSRAAMHTHPFFEVGLDQPVSEHQGDVLMGTLGWTGNFRFTFKGNGQMLGIFV
ncbi:MAG: glycoside hydrolase family 36 N-terminal domain-containing protein [Bacteroides cellulosilyticus]